MRWNSCCIRELIELNWRLDFTKISCNGEEKGHFSSAMPVLPFSMSNSSRFGYRQQLTTEPGSASISGKRN